MAASMTPYDRWLSDKLVSLNPDVDAEVFVTYIAGILETDTTLEEKRESLEEILGEVVAENREEVCEEVIKKWLDIHEQKNGTKTEKEDIDKQLSKILSKQQLTVAKGRQLTDEERARKQTILAQYSQVSDEENEDGPDDPGGAAAPKSSGSGDGSLLVVNTNKGDVMKIEKEKREKSKLEHEKKKEKEKQDREAQRQKAQDRKESEKKRTQKGERRR